MTIGGYRVDAVAGKRRDGASCGRATQLALARTVALKVISPDFAGDPTFRYRFRSASSPPPSTIPTSSPIIEAGEGRRVALLYPCAGSKASTLGCLVDNMGPLAPDRAVGVVAQVASALDTAHGAGLIHRDVKPANILIETRNGSDHAYLSDFGLVKRVGSDPGLTGSHGWIGTVDYVAPEQVRGEELGAAADIYAPGRRALHGADRHGPVPPSRHRRPAVGVRERPVAAARRHPRRPARRLDDVLAWAMAKEPAQRYQAAGDMVAALQATIAPPVPPPAPPVMAPTAPAPTSWDQPEPSPAETAASSGQPEPGASSVPTPPERPQVFEPTPRRRLRRRWAIPAAALVAVVAVVAAVTLATGGGKAKAPRVAGSSTPARQASIGPGRTMTFQLADSSNGPVNATVPAKPIASSATNTAGVTLSLYLVKRDGQGAVLLVFALQVDPSVAGDVSTSESMNQSLSANFTTPGNRTFSVSSVALVDTVALKEYQTFMVDPSNDATCLCSVLNNDVNGGTFYYAALVAAPPNNVKQASFLTGLASIPNVTIS